MYKNLAAFLGLLINKKIVYFFIIFCLKTHKLNIIKIKQEDYKKELVKDIEIFPKKIETRSVSMVVKDTEILQKMKNKGQLSIVKKYHKMRKNTLW